MFCPCGFPNPQGSNCGSATSVPVDLQSTGELIAGLQPARIKNPQLLTWGLQIPEDKRDSRGHCDMVNLQIDHGEL